MYYKQQRDRDRDRTEETRPRSKQTNSPSTCLQQQRLLSSHLKGGQPIYRPLLFGACCRTCTWDISVPPRGTSLPNCIRSRCTESRPFCFHNMVALAWLQSPSRTSPTLLTYHTQILSRWGKHTDSAPASPPSMPCEWCVRMEEQ